MIEEGKIEQLKVSIEEWQPTTPEADQEFFEKTVPQLVEAKKQSREKYSSELAAQRSLDYLTNRLHALKPGDIVPFARLGDHIAGFVLVRWDEREKRTQLEQFYIERQYQSRGIGTRLLERAMQHARKTRLDNSRGIFLTTEETNEGAQRLYARYGFHISEIPAPEAGEIRLELDFKTPRSPERAL